jgi:hypothetical protein
MFKTLFRNLWRGIKELGSESSLSGRRKKRGYRSGFQRILWAGILLFMYFGFIYYTMMSSEAGSEDNSGIFKLLLGATIVAAFGAYLAPRFSDYVESWTSSGRRKKLQKSQNSFMKKKSESESNRKSNKSAE